MHLKMQLLSQGLKLSNSKRGCRVSALSLFCEIDTTNGFLTLSSFRSVLFPASYSRIDPCFTVGKRIGVWDCRAISWVYWKMTIFTSIVYAVTSLNVDIQRLIHNKICKNAKNSWGQSIGMLKIPRGQQASPIRTKRKKVRWNLPASNRALMNLTAVLARPVISTQKDRKYQTCQFKNPRMQPKKSRVLPLSLTNEKIQNMSFVAFAI